VGPPGGAAPTLALAALAKLRRPWRAVYCGPSVLGVQAAVASGLAVACLTHSAVRDDFRVLGARESLPRLPDSEIVLFGPSARADMRFKQLSSLVREYFSQPVAIG
jgi:DNA-binding transcriptional LysR family regulator